MYEVIGHSEEFGTCQSRKSAFVETWLLFKAQVLTLQHRGAALSVTVGA